MKKYLIKDLIKGLVTITKEQLLEIPQGGGGDKGDKGDKGSKNNVFGNYAMHQLTGEKNCAFGYYSMYNSTNSNNNACFGNNSGGRLVNGNGNVFIGDGAGFISGQKVDASGTTVIGKDAISTRNDEIVIGKNTDTHVTIAGVEFTRAQILALKALV